MKCCLLAIVVLLFGCAQKYQKVPQASQACGIYKVSDLKRMLLHERLGGLPDLECYTRKDTILEGEEGVSWKGTSYYYEGHLAFMAESNWQDTKRVSRITIQSPLIREGEIFVGQPFSKIGNLVATKVPNSPDGYLFLTYKADSAISIQLDISTESAGSRLVYGVDDVSKIPGTLTIESIVIM